VVAKQSANTKAVSAAAGAVTGGVGSLVTTVLSSKYRNAILAGFAGSALAVVVAVQIIFASLVSVIAGGVSDAAGASDAAVTSSSGASAGTIAAIQDATQFTSTPWTVLASLMYYESGVGVTVAQQPGVCPSGSPTGALCPSTLNLPSGPLTTGTPSGNGPGTVNMSVDTVGSAIPGPTSGFNPAQGRNGTVPVSLPASSPDFATTDTADWDCIRQAESGDNYTQASGAYGILASTWTSLGYSGTPGQAPKSQQDAAALEILRYEGHFYGAWNDLCTDPGGTAATEISYVPPGVADPSGGGGVVPGTGGAGTCPGNFNPKTGKWSSTYVGLYCLRPSGAVSTATANDLTLSSAWLATTLGRAFTADGVGDAMDLTVGVTSQAGVAVLDAGNTTATAYRTDVIRALATLPVKGNTPALDTNVYDLAVAWLQGISPTPPPGCSTIGSSTTIPGPYSSTDLLGPSQVLTAQQIVTDAVAAKAGPANQVAVVAGALQQTGLDKPTRIFTTLSGNSVSSEVSAFLRADKSPTASADSQDSAVLGGATSDYTGWLSGAQQLVDAATSPNGGCGGPPPVPGGSRAARQAVVAAEAEIGLPYVWGGGGTSGPSGSALGPPNQVGQPGFDCSGLVQYAFARAGVNLPRTAQTQFDFVQARGTLTTDSSLLQPGDLVFYSDGEPGINHVAIYLGKGRIIQAPQTGMDVSYGTLSGDSGLGFMGGGAAA
jgi:cell wall-associated NlpC family hydrolase